MYPAAVLCYIPESNMSWMDSEQIVDLLSAPRFQPCLAVSKDPEGKGRVGIYTNENMKRVYADDMVTLLTMGTLRKARHQVQSFDDWLKDQNDETLALNGIDLEDASSKQPAAMQLLEKQMESYRQEKKVPKDVIFGKTKITYTGKGPSSRDDVIMSLQIANTWMRLMLKDNEFRSRLQRLGISLIS